MDIIATAAAAAPGGHYSQAVVHGGIIYVSGQLAVDPANGAKELGPIEAQARVVLHNVKSILEASGSRLDRVLKAHVYISDIAMWDEVDHIFAEYFGEHRPARAVIPTRELHHGFKIEMDVIAALA